MEICRRWQQIPHAQKIVTLHILYRTFQFLFFLRAVIEAAYAWKAWFIACDRKRIIGSLYLTIGIISGLASPLPPYQNVGGGGISRLPLCMPVTFRYRRLLPATPPHQVCHHFYTTKHPKYQERFGYLLKSPLIKQGSSTWPCSLMSCAKCSMFPALQPSHISA